MIILAMIMESIAPTPLFAQQPFVPEPGSYVSTSPDFQPPILKGIIIDTQTPFNFDFIMDKGNQEMSDEELEGESSKLLRYFLAALTMPEEDLWVNLSPHESDRIIPTTLAATELGHDLLAQDYLLKQLSASLTHPDEDIGRMYWKKVRELAKEKFGSDDIPLSTFNKVWIVPQKAKIYENRDRAYVVSSQLKVMTERDYMANRDSEDNQLLTAESNDVTSSVMREVIIPEIEYEVNHGTYFAPLRQIYQSYILAVWYKDKLRDSILADKYFNQRKIKGIDVSNANAKEEFYTQYIAAFKKGVYNLIKEDYDASTQTIMPRQYFSGGVIIAQDTPYVVVSEKDAAVLGLRKSDSTISNDDGNLVRLRGRYAPSLDFSSLPKDFAMLARAEKTARLLRILDPAYTSNFAERAFNSVIDKKILGVDSKSPLAELISVSDQHNDPEVPEAVLKQVKKNLKAGKVTEVSFEGDIIDHIIGKKRFGRPKSIRKKMASFNKDPENWENLIRTVAALKELQELSQRDEYRNLLRVNFLMGNNEINFVKSVALGYIAVPEEMSSRVDLIEIAEFILQHFTYTYVDSWGFKHMHILSPMHRRDESRVHTLQSEALSSFREAVESVEEKSVAMDRVESWYAAADTYVYGQAISREGSAVAFEGTKLSPKRQANNVFWNNLFIKFFNGYTIRNPNNQLWLTPYEVDAFLDEHQAVGIIAGHQHVPSFSDVDHRLFNVAVYGKKQKGFLVISPEDGVYFNSTFKNKRRPIMSRSDFVAKMEQDLATEMVRDAMKASGSQSVPIKLTEAQEAEIKSKESRLADIQKDLESIYADQDNFVPNNARLQDLIREQRILQARLLKIRVGAAVDRRIRAPQVSRQILLDDPNTFLFPNTFTNVPASLLDGSFVVARVDYNSTVKNGQISMNTRIVATVPMLVQAIKAGAKIGLYSHLEDPSIEVESRLVTLEEKYQKRAKKIKRRRKKYKREQVEKGEELDPKIMSNFLRELADAQDYYQEEFVARIDEHRATIRKEVNADLSLAPVAEELQRLINEELEKEGLSPVRVHFNPDVLTARDGQKIIKDMNPGDVILFENTRIAREEMLLHKTKSNFQKKFDALITELKGDGNGNSPLPNGTAAIISRLESIRDGIVFNYHLVEEDVNQARADLASIISDSYYSRLLGIEFTQPTDNLALTIRQLMEYYISPASRNRLSEFFGLMKQLDLSLKEIIDPLRDHIEHQKRLFFGARFYVNDSAATLHRAHASLLPPTHLSSFVGPLVVQEIALLETLKANLEFAVLGGKNAKSLDEKMVMLLPALSNLPTMKRIAVFGQPAIAFLKAMEQMKPGSAPAANRIPLKVPTGKTPEKYIDFAQRLLEDPQIREQLVVPEYLLVVRSAVASAQLTSSDIKVVHISQAVEKGWEFLDVAPASVVAAYKQIKGLKQGFWNGPAGRNRRDLNDRFATVMGNDFLEVAMKHVRSTDRTIVEEAIREGVNPIGEENINAEIGRGRIGTYLNAKLLIKIAQSDDEKSVVAGGGGSLETIERYGFLDEFTHVLTGGGSSLNYLGRLTLAGYEALTQSSYPKTFHDYERIEDLLNEGGILERGTFAVLVRRGVLHMIDQLDQLWDSFDSVADTDLRTQKMEHVRWIREALLDSQRLRPMPLGQRHFQEGDEELADQVLNDVTQILFQGAVRNLQMAAKSKSRPKFRDSLKRASVSGKEGGKVLGTSERAFEKASDIATRIIWVNGMIFKLHNQLATITIDVGSSGASILSKDADVNSMIEQAVEQISDKDQKPNKITRYFDEELTSVRLELADGLPGVTTQEKRFIDYVTKIIRNGVRATVAELLIEEENPKGGEPILKGTGEYVSYNDTVEDREGIKNEVVIRTTYDEERGGIVIDIEDNGVGIQSDSADKLLRYLYSRNNVYRGKDGQMYRVAFGKSTGRGLSSFKLLINEMGDRVEILANPSGQGTIIRAFVPDLSSLQKIDYVPDSIRSTDDQALLSNIPETKGGIDFNPSYLNIESNGVPVEIDFNDRWQNFQNVEIPGLYPQIYQMLPVTNLPQLLGYEELEEDGTLINLSLLN